MPSARFRRRVHLGQAAAIASADAGDSTAPNLSSASGTITASTTADLAVTTDEDNGTLYVVVTTSATPPNATQIKAGQDHTGVAAVFADDQAIAATGSKTFSATGLSVNTSYRAHFMHEDAATNQSSVATSAAFIGNPTAFGAALKAWYKADVGITLNGSDVASWADQSGNGATLSQGTASKQPAFSATGFNSLPTLNITASADECLVTSATAVALGAATASFFAVGQLHTETQSNAGLVCFTENGDANDFGSAGSARAICRNGTGNAITTFASSSARGNAAVSLATNARMGYIFDGVNTTPYVDNVAGTAAAYSTAFGATGGVTVGCGSDLTTAWDGLLSEVVILSSAPSSAMRTMLDDYFKAKWGL